MGLHPRVRRKSMWFGGLICSVGIFAGSDVGGLGVWFRAFDIGANAGVGFAVGRRYMFAIDEDVWADVWVQIGVVYRDDFVLIEWEDLVIIKRCSRRDNVGVVFGFDKICSCGGTGLNGCVCRVGVRVEGGDRWVVYGGLERRNQVSSDRRDKIRF
jgi:hypothetical protein